MEIEGVLALEFLLEFLLLQELLVMMNYNMTKRW